MLVALFIPYMRFVAKFELDARRFTLPVLKPSPSAAALVTAYRVIGLVALAGLWLPLLSHGWPNPFVRAAVMVLSTSFTLTTSPCASA